MPSKQTTNFLPVLSLLIAATLWGVIWYPMRLLEQGGLHGAWQAVVLYATAALIFVRCWPRVFEAYPKALLNLTVMALASGWCNLSFMLAVLDGEIVRVLLLFYLSPIWAVVLGWLLLGERPSRGGLSVLAIALSGAVIMLWEPRVGYPWPETGADWLALSSGFAFAIMNVETRYLQSIDIDVKTVVAWLGCVVVAGVVVVVMGISLPVVSGSVWVGALLLGALAITVMTLAVQYGVTHMPVQRSAVILLFEIVAGALSSQLLTDEVIGWQEWVGGVLIILAAYLTAKREIKS
ncbi:hypothetical protein BOW53_08665 [Solemya pervernicosa gill symbiont]|uniref:EamA domain-containing protein n=2 Tax=Gammaproteobacteria incertae sedis TaxID=118884 RepID=A0A1T2L5B5_9GAMM|nr:hypothetical protein BOW53_08665 [Solemya pervernicosa gill symbiont]